MYFYQSGEDDVKLKVLLTAKFRFIAVMLKDG